MNAIPKGLAWHCMRIVAKGYVTKEPVYLFWHDVLEIMWEIFGDPVFARHMEYNPYEVFEGGEYEYGSPCTWLGCILWPAGVDNRPYLMGQRGSGQTTGCCHDIWPGLCVKLSP